MGLQHFQIQAENFFLYGTCPLIFTRMDYFLPHCMQNFPLRSVVPRGTVYEDNPYYNELALVNGPDSKKEHHNSKLREVKINSNLNWADILTKLLCQVKPGTITKFIMRW
jgi:hypothetical protein